MFKMIFKNNRFLTGLIALYVLVMIYLIYYTLSFSNHLIYDLNVLSISDYEEIASSSFNQLSTISILGLLIGLGLIILINKSESSQIVYVEKKEKKKTESKSKEDISSKGLNLDVDKFFLENKKNEEASINLLNALCEKVNAVQGLLYLLKNKKFVLQGGYAVYDLKEKTQEFEVGDGLTGQAAAEKKPLIINELEPGYLTVASGLGKTDKLALGIFPLIKGNKVLGIIELAKFNHFNKKEEESLQEILNKWSEKLGTTQKKTTTKTTKKSNKDQ